MTKIIKAKETMSAKERVLKTFQLQKTDRVTIGYEANASIHKKLANELGIKDGNMELTRRALGVDYRGVNAAYCGPMLFKELPERRTNPVDGFNMRWIEHQSGGYWDFCDFPLQGADSEKIASFPVPDPNNYNYGEVGEKLKEYKEFAIYLGGAGSSDIINSMGRIMGMEDILCNLLLEDEATLILLNRRMNMQLAVMEKTLELYKGKFDFMWLGEDLGTQNSPMISLALFRKVIRPIQQKFIDLAKIHNLPVMVHTCGSSSWAYEDFIEMGVTAVDTLQPEATNMSPDYLKNKFGGILSFRGCISTAGPLAFGTSAETRGYCKKALQTMMKGYGYHFAPTHAIQDNSPVKNVIAMYQAAHDFGIYK